MSSRFFFQKNQGIQSLVWTCPLLKKNRYRIPPSPRSRCPVGCKWMGYGWLNYACKSPGPSGQNQAKLCSKIQLGFMDKCSKEASTPHRETTTQCSKRYNMVWIAQTGKQCTSMCGDATEKGSVISAVSAVWAKWTKGDFACVRSRFCWSWNQPSNPKFYYSHKPFWPMQKMHNLWSRIEKFCYQFGWGIFRQVLFCLGHCSIHNP